MSEHEAARTLVKSPPELWEVCSDAASLGRHLQPFGEIKITRLEPETTVAWEGERASGTVRLEASGWGTKVTLTAAATAPAEVEPPPPPPPQPSQPPAPAAVRRRRRGGVLGWLLERFGESSPPPAPPPAAAPPPPAAAPAAPPRPPELDPPAVLGAALDSLGQAHHRPFSRG
jgi:hypothetical protein